MRLRSLDPKKNEFLFSSIFQVCTRSYLSRQAHKLIYKLFSISFIMMDSTQLRRLQMFSLVVVFIGLTWVGLAMIFSGTNHFFFFAQCFLLTATANSHTFSFFFFVFLFLYNFHTNFQHRSTQVLCTPASNAISPCSS